MTGSPLTIGILSCGTNRSQWRQAHGDFGEWFIPFLQKATSAQLAFKIFNAHLDELPTSTDKAVATDQADAWLVTGSPVSVYENHPWQLALSDFLRRAAMVKPVIGICYGHQLLHQLFGGSIEKGPHWGIGAHTYQVTDTPEWVATENSVDQFRILASHQDQVIKAAPTSKLIASSQFCPYGITQIGDRILTIQTHPELTTALSHEVYEFRRQEQGAQQTSEAVASLEAPLDDGAFGLWVFDFIVHVQGLPKHE